MRGISSSVDAGDINFSEMWKPITPTHWIHKWIQWGITQNVIWVYYWTQKQLQHVEYCDNKLRISFFCVSIQYIYWIYDQSCYAFVCVRFYGRKRALMTQCKYFVHLSWTPPCSKLVTSYKCPRGICPSHFYNPCLTSPRQQQRKFGRSSREHNRDYDSAKGGHTSGYQDYKLALPLPPLSVEWRMARVENLQGLRHLHGPLLIPSDWSTKWGHCLHPCL